MIVSFKIKTEEEFKMNIMQNVFSGQFEGNLHSAKFPNTYSLGSTIETCISIMKIRIYQLISKQNEIQSRNRSW